ncbi:hypothetical protein WICMUC_005082 [Wickerhamomyces mucosus]|uniref:Uncharacterized protein n=1 Tax=Wickerhamomyces mucosus TaxID=1378264 RepID=A0A9P8PBE8_9ASCO|nr:hypothetical protein WICMUC_005082 [Wickerhamomyces mucosus]
MEFANDTRDRASTFSPNNLAMTLSVIELTKFDLAPDLVKEPISSLSYNRTCENEPSGIGFLVNSKREVNAANEQILSSILGAYMNKSKECLPYNLDLFSDSVGSKSIPGEYAITGTVWLSVSNGGLAASPKCGANDEILAIGFGAELINLDTILKPDTDSSSLTLTKTLPEIPKSRSSL